MSQRHTFAVIYAEDVDRDRLRWSAERPSDEQVRKVIDTGEWSVRRFWSDNVPWLDISMEWMLPCLEISPDRTPENNAIPRSRLIDAAVQAAVQHRGLSLTSVDHVFVIVHGAEDIEYGGLGRHAVVRTREDLSTMCHEFGHALGFGHSRGHAVPGTLWDDEYGSKYDVMALPSDYLLPESDEALPTQEATVGPMIARAVVYFDMPQALTEPGMVQTRTLGSEPVVADLWAAGRSDGAGQPELLVFNTAGNADFLGDPNSLLMVEYRQPDRNRVGRSRWDFGLDGTVPPDGRQARDTPGVVVYRIKQARHLDGRPALENGKPFNRPYYAGTIALDAIDQDVDIEFVPWGTFTVSLRDQPLVDGEPPAHVRVKVGRAPLNPAHVRIHGDPVEEHVRGESVWRVPPDLPPIFGEQEYIVTDTLTQWTFQARAVGIGGISDLREPEQATPKWTADDVEIPHDAGPHPLRGGRLSARVDTATNALVLNNPAGLSEVMLVRVTASIDEEGRAVTASVEATFQPQTLQPSESLSHLKHWWRLKSNRQPQLPPTEDEIWELRGAWEALVRTAPDLAARFQHEMDAIESVWRGALRTEALRIDAVRRLRTMPSLSM